MTLRPSPARRAPEVTVQRLSIYARTLSTLQDEGYDTVSSAMLAERTPFSAAQIRRDLTWFGQFGTRGKGYDIPLLRAKLNRILGVHVPRRVALIGVGNLGSALLGYTGFADHNFQIVAAFDAAPGKVGTETPQGITIHHIDKLAELAVTERLEIAMIAVPPQAAQTALNVAADAKIRAVLNFAPTQLTAPAGLQLRNVDLSIELEALSYFLEHGDEPA